MATIQIRNVPDDAYDVLRERAAKSGQSLQSYMRDQVVQMADLPTKAEVFERINALRAESGYEQPSVEEIVEAIHEGRR